MKKLRSSVVGLAASVGLAGLGRAQQPTDPIEQRLVAHADAHNAEAIDFLERIVNINSGTMNAAGVREVGRAFMPRFEALGFSVEWVDGTAFERGGHLLASRDGRGPHVLLIGHLDTVFEPASPFQKFARRPPEQASGPGIVDMKGGDVIILQALAALHDTGVLDALRITVILTGDEERLGRPLELSRQPLIEAADRADIAIAFENGDNDPETAVISRRGATQWTLRVHGQPAHSSQIFRSDIGAGAIFEAARILNRFYTALAGEQFLTFNPGLILGGTSVDFDATQARGTAFGKSNVIAENVVVTGDLRSLSPEQLSDAKSRMQTIVSEALNGTEAEIEFRDSYPPMAPTDGNRRLLALLDQVSRDLGFGGMRAVDPSRAGAADIAFTAGRVEMAIDGLGLLGDAEHTEAEYADLRTLPMQVKRTAVLLYRLSKP